MHYFIMILLASFFYASEGEQPTWARDLVLDSTNVYIGIGFSTESKADATDEALKEFSSSIKVKVSSEIVVSSSEETKGRKTKGTEKYLSESKAIIDEELRGINPTKYWKGDGGQGEGHYVLVVYDIDEFNANNEKLISQEIKRLEEELALTKQENQNEREIKRQEIEMDALESEKKLKAGENKQKQAILKEEERDRKRDQKSKREQRRLNRERKLKKKLLE